MKTFSRHDKVALLAAARFPFGKAVARPSFLLRMVAIAMTGLASFGMAQTAWGESDQGQMNPPRHRVGTFDSRAVAVAYTASESFNRTMKQKIEEANQARKAGDLEKAKLLDAERKATQELLYQQAFSTASVANILEEIKDQLPSIAQEAGVETLISKWDVTVPMPSVEYVDVTFLIIKPFKPSPRTIQMVQDLQKKPPLSAEEVQKYAARNGKGEPWWTFSKPRAQLAKLGQKIFHGGKDSDQ